MLVDLLSDTLWAFNVHICPFKCQVCFWKRKWCLHSADTMLPYSNAQQMSVLWLIKYFLLFLYNFKLSLSNLAFWNSRLESIFSLPVSNLGLYVSMTFDEYRLPCFQSGIHYYHIKFHFLIIICEFCYTLQKMLWKRVNYVWDILSGWKIVSSLIWTLKSKKLFLKNLSFFQPCTCHLSDYDALDQ